MGYDKRNLRHEKERARKLETRKASVAFARICMLLHAFTRLRETKEDILSDKSSKARTISIQ